MKAFRNHMVSDYYLKPTTGYAYSDVGRENLDAIYAEIFHTEAALVRSQFVSARMRWQWLFWVYCAQVTR